MRQTAAVQSSSCRAVAPLRKQVSCEWR